MGRRCWVGPRWNHILSRPSSPVNCQIASRTVENTNLIQPLLAIELGSQLGINWASKPSGTWAPHPGEPRTLILRGAMIRGFTGQRSLESQGNPHVSSVKQLEMGGFSMQPGWIFTDFPCNLVSLPKGMGALFTLRRLVAAGPSSGQWPRTLAATLQNGAVHAVVNKMSSHDQY